jgi:hypothetical protein
MIIPNYLGEKTTILIIDSQASSVPPENSLSDAKNALRLEKKSSSPKSGNIAFLYEWIKLFEAKESVNKDIENFKKGEVE